MEAIDRIQRRTAAGRPSLDDELVQVWVVHNLEIVGEAARGISDDVRSRHPDVPWREMVGMRNVLAHGYFGIDVERVWATVRDDLPKARRRVEEVLAQLKD